MKYILDTNICIYLMKHQPPEVARRFAACREGDVVISVITLAELYFGVWCCPVETREQNEQALHALLDMIPAVPFDAAAARAYAPIRQASERKRADALDKLIAAHAVAANVTLVTNNQQDFRRYPGLKVENWLEG